MSYFKMYSEKNRNNMHKYDQKIVTFYHDTSNKKVTTNVSLKPHSLFATKYVRV